MKRLRESFEEIYNKDAKLPTDPEQTSSKLILLASTSTPINALAVVQTVPAQVVIRMPF